MKNKKFNRNIRRKITKALNKMASESGSRSGPAPQAVPLHPATESPNKKPRLIPKPLKDLLNPVSIPNNTDTAKKEKNVYKKPGIVINTKSVSTTSKPIQEKINVKPAATIVSAEVDLTVDEPTQAPQIAFAPPFGTFDVVRMQTDDIDIKIANKQSIAYHNCATYRIRSAELPSWHMIVVHHFGKYKKEEILKALVNVAAHSEFIPIAYRQAKYEDYFFVRQCAPFIAKIFRSNLKIRIPADKQFVNLTVKLNVSDYKLGQINVNKKLMKACTDRLYKLQISDGISKLVNLDNLASSPELCEICIDFSNTANLQLLCATLMDCIDFDTINGLKLAKNNLTDLTPFGAMNPKKIIMFDLRDNNIQDIGQLKQLKKFAFTQLFLAGNPVISVEGYLDKLKDILPFVTRVDGMSTRQLLISQVHIGSGTNPIEVIFQGDLITPANTHDPFIFKKFKSSDMWHQVIINHEGKHTKDELLKAIFAVLNSHEFFPCYYRSEGYRDTFLIRNCFEQMDLLYNNKLTINVPPVKEPVIIHFKMNVANYKPGQLNPPEKIQKIITDKFNLMERTLHFDEFAKNPELANIEVCLSNPRTLAHILLQAARRYLGSIERLVLKNNGIESAKGMHALSWMKNLKAIDISFNKIDCLSEMETIPKGLIVDVVFEGNPLCNKIQNPFDYVNKVKRIFPNITKLDGRELSQEGICIAQKNYLCSLDGYDIVEQFVQQYFTTYDSLSRTNMKGLYCDRAIMTMSCNFAGVTKSNETQLKTYGMRCRNLLKIASFTVALGSTYVGPEQIISIWKSFGSVEHDYHGFKIDLTYYTPDTVVFTVNGVFKELGAALNQEELIIGFVRTFVLKRVSTDMGMFGRSIEYKIFNEQFFVYRPTLAQAKQSFVTANCMEIDEDAGTISSDDKEGMMIIFQELTCLVKLWCFRCLDKSAWNFKGALELFQHLCHEDKIPETAFQFAAKV